MIAPNYEVPVWFRRTSTRAVCISPVPSAGFAHLRSMIEILRLPIQVSLTGNILFTTLSETDQKISSEEVQKHHLISYPKAY